MRLLEYLFFPHRRGASDVAYHQAMGESDDLIRKMREASPPAETARKITADIWEQHQNVPFMTSVYEAVREMKAATTDHRR